jgi:DNA-binding GntR family transcriptional regulator
LDDVSIIQMPKTVSEQIADTLRSEILAGVIPPGTRLFQDEEAERLQVSRTPLREAFRHLEAERLLQIVPNRGAIVTRLTAEEVREIYLIRTHVEPLAAAMSARNASDEDLEAIGRLLKELEYAWEHDWEHNRRKSLLDLNKTFHFLIYEASGMPRLVNIISSLWGPVEAMRAAYVAGPIAATHGAEDHVRLYRAIRERDEEAAAEITRQHLAATAATLDGLVDAAGGPGARAPGRWSMRDSGRAVERDARDRRTVHVAERLSEVRDVET